MKMTFKQFLDEATQKYDNIDDFVEGYSEDIDSAFEIWMHEDSQERMFALYQKGAKFISKSFDFNGDKDKFWAKVDKWKDAQKAKGYVDFDSEENTDFTEFLMMKQ